MIAGKYLLLSRSADGRMAKQRSVCDLDQQRRSSFRHAPFVLWL